MTAAAEYKSLGKSDEEPISKKVCITKYRRYGNRGVWGHDVILSPTLPVLISTALVIPPTDLPPSFYREIVVRHKTKTGNTHLERQEDGKQENEILRFEKFTSSRRVADPSPEDACYATCCWWLQNVPIYLPPLIF